MLSVRITKPEDICCLDSNVQGNAQVNVRMYEVYNEKVRDLLTVPKVQSDFLKVVETVEDGFTVQVSSYLQYRHMYT